MSNQKIIDRARNLFLTKCSERDDQLKGDIQYTFNNLGSRNILRSSIASSDISRVLSKEFKIRSDISWQSLSRSLEIGDVEVLETLNSDLNEELKLELNQQRQGLIDLIKSKLRNMGLLEHMKGIESSLSHFQNQAISKYGAEIDLYIDNLNKLAMLKRPQEAVTPEEGIMPDKKKVFIVHGHDEAARERVARFIEKLELTPIILHEQVSAGRTIIEKLEAFAEVGYAIVLLTPDDEGRKKNEVSLKDRARQNVILELGYFIGKLKRENVCALHKSTVEIPSDYLGVLFVPFDGSDGWQLKLAKEMKAAGLNIDMNKVV